MSVKERLKDFIKMLGMGQGAFEKTVGLSNGYVNNIRQSIQPDKLQKIALHFPQLNTGWLMTGEGNMLKSPADVMPPITRGELTELAAEVFSEKLKSLIDDGAVSIRPSTGRGKSETALKVLKELNLKEFSSHIPVKLVSTKARAGFAGAYYSDEYLSDMPTVLIEADKEYKGKYLAFEVDGDSMEPEYLKGDVVICREVKRDLWQYKLHIQDWDFVIAHGTQGIMLKEIVDHDVESGEITCHSLNTEEHPDFKLNLKEVAYLYNVVEVRRSGKSKRRNR